MASEFILAAKDGNMATLYAWLMRGNNIQVTDNEGRTALHWAAHQNRIEVAKYLINHNAVVDAPMSDGGTPLFDAVACGNNEMAVLLLQAGADPYVVDENGLTLLHTAIDGGCYATIAFLIERYPALKKIKNDADILPLDYANDDDMVNIFAMSHQAVTAPLTRPILDGRITSIHLKIIFDKNYFKGLIPDDEIHLQKWKAYLYLRKCVLDYKEGATEELLQVISFLQISSNKTWFTKKLMDHSKTEAGEEWGSGSHEWLERSLIIDVLKRSAGIYAGFEAEATYEGIQIDWLFIQATFRSPTKYIFFKQDNSMLREGHSGSVKSDSNTFCSKGSPAFHKLLEKAFYDSHHITSFIIRVHNVFITDIISGKKPIIADNKDYRRVVTGAATNDSYQANFFRTNSLRPFGYNVTNNQMKTIINNTATKPLDEYSEGPIDSESSEDDLIGIARNGR